MKIAIAGYGVEGRANYQYWQAQGHDLTIVDERELSTLDLPDGASTLLGEGVFRKLGDFDLVVRTAGLDPSKIETKPGALWSATNEFFATCPADIVGVTGTKGKGTTSSLLASIFTASGRTVHLVGNIGTAALAVLPEVTADDIVIFELSSFQLWDIKRSPHVAVVLPIEPDHLNAHHGMEDYVSAKSNIRTFQGDKDTCIYHFSNELANKVAHVTEQGTAIRYGIADDGGVYEKDGNFYQNEQIICSTEALQLLGKHNVENACAAITASRSYDIDNQAIEKGLRDFQGLPHRLEFVRTVGGVDYFNDSFSSAPTSTIAAVVSFEQPEILILGGTDKGADFTDLINTLATRKNIKQILIIGEIRHKLADLLKGVGVVDNVQVLEAQTMNDILSTATRAAADGDVVLLSPGCASFDMFRDFYDRGDQFRSLVQAL